MPNAKKRKDKFILQFSIDKKMIFCTKISNNVIDKSLNP